MYAIRSYYGVALDRHIGGEPARDQQQVVIDHIAAGQFQRFDQVERRLLRNNFV